MPLQLERKVAKFSDLYGIILSVLSGAVLGFVQIAEPLGLVSQHVAPILLASGLVALAAAYSVWRALDRFWSRCGLGFLFGLAYFGTSLHWLGSSANPNPDTFVFREIVFGFGVLWLFVPWWALWFGIAHILSRLGCAESAAPIAFILSFSATNLMLADIVLGIPLAPLSLLTLDTALATLLRYVGQFGADTFVVGLGTMLGVALHSRSKAAILLALIAPVAVALTPATQPSGAENEHVAGDRVYLAQPSLPHISLIDPERVTETVNAELLRHVRDGIASNASLIVLPEGALIVDLTAPDDTFGAQISALLPEGVHVIAGFDRAVVNQSTEGFTVDLFNSVALISREGVTWVHDKAHLVPFGETMPAILFRMGFNVVAGPAGGFERGDKIGIFGSPSDLPPFALAICYEAILSGAISRETGNAEWMLNISAEALFRGTVGPRLLRDHIRLRAVETGLPVLRSTAHAFSGLIGPDGTVLTSLPPEARSGAVVGIPGAHPTFFRAAGYTPLYGALVALCLALLALRGLGHRKSFLAITR